MDYGEFKSVTDMYTNYWGTKFDEFKISSWFDVLGKLNAQSLLLTLKELTTESKYPGIKEIVDKYEELKNKSNKQKQNNKEKEYENSTKLVGEAEKCIYCNELGLHMYWSKGYEYVCRCICRAGQNPYKFSAPQITKGLMYIDPMTGKEKSIYIQDMNDVFSLEEIELIKIKASKVYKTGNFEAKDVKLFMNDLAEQMDIR